MPANFGRGLLVFALMVFAVVSWQWINDRQVQPQTPDNPVTMAETQSDYYLEDFQIVNVSNPQTQGNSGRRLEVTGESLTHHFLLGHSIIENPSVQLHSQSDDAWNAQARQGTVSAEFDVLDLQGDVEVTHNPASGVAPISVDTQSITIDTTERVIQTEQPVEVTGNGWQYKANGMRAEVENGTLSFTSGVEAQFANPN